MSQVGRTALVLGSGSIGSRHARNLAGLGVKVLAYDLDAVAAERLEATGVARALRDRELAEADIVVVATPSSAHASDLLWALRRGAHVFVEKPLAASWAELDEIGNVPPADRIVMAGCNLRFTDGYRLVREHLDRVGRVLSIQSRCGSYLPDWHPGQDHRQGYSARKSLGGGVVLDAIHEIDYVLDLAGPVAKVSAVVANTGSLGIETDDVADLVLVHAGGTVSSIHLDYVDRSYSRGCRVVGSKRSINWDYAAGLVEVLGQGDPETLATGLDQDRNQMYVREMENFLAACDGRENVLNGMTEASRAVDVALTAMEIGARTA